MSDEQTARMLADICTNEDTNCPARFLHNNVCPLGKIMCKDVEPEDWLTRLAESIATLDEEDDGGPAPRPVKEDACEPLEVRPANPAPTAAEVLAFEQGFDIALLTFDRYARMNRDHGREDFASKLLYYIERASFEKAAPVTLFKHGEHETALYSATYKRAPK